jgi:UDP-3-O-[3-hydroxymyristoyl] glucosamine N-acyltransferase
MAYLSGANGGLNSEIHSSAILTKPYEVQLGDNCFIDGFFWCDTKLSTGNNVIIKSHVSVEGPLKLGDNVTIESGCKFLGGAEGIEVGNNVKIGANAVIGDGVKLADHSVVLHGAIVEKKDFFRQPN